jgi:preprotein translocase subunit SecE
VSDERDDADAAADGGAEEPRGGRTAVVTRPQRPSGKRSRLRPEAAENDVTDDESSSGAVELIESTAEDEAGKKPKKAKKAPKPRGQSTNPIVYVYNYLKQVIAELRKVIWPNRKQMGTYTSVVLAFLVFMVTLIGLVDVGLAKLVLLVFG